MTPKLLTNNEGASFFTTVPLFKEEVFKVLSEDNGISGLHEILAIEMTCGHCDKKSIHSRIETKDPKTLLLEKITTIHNTDDMALF